MPWVIGCCKAVIPVLPYLRSNTRLVGLIGAHRNGGNLACDFSGYGQPTSSPCPPADYVYLRVVEAANKYFSYADAIRGKLDACHVTFPVYGLPLRVFGIQFVFAPGCIERNH